MKLSQPELELLSPKLPLSTLSTTLISCHTSFDNVLGTGLHSNSHILQIYHQHPTCQHVFSDCSKTIADTVAKDHATVSHESHHCKNSVDGRTWSICFWWLLFHGKGYWEGQESQGSSTSPLTSWFYTHIWYGTLQPLVVEEAAMQRRMPSGNWLLELGKTSIRNNVIKLFLHQWFMECSIRIFVV